jgi:hypothetical protein
MEAPHSLSAKVRILRYIACFHPVMLAYMKALQEFAARPGQRRLLDLMGKLEWDSSFDYKAERARD